MRLKRITKSEVESESFAKLYKFLFEIDFKDLSNDAKILYTLLRDRHNLSLENGWENSNGEVYLIYTREEMCEMLGCSNNTVGKALKQLITYKLIETERQGLNKPNLIYVLDVDVENTRKCKKCDSRSAKNAIQEMQDMHTNKTNINNTDIKKTEKRNNKGATLAEVAPCVFLFFSLYRDTFGREHPYIKIEQIERAEHIISSFLKESCLEGDLEALRVIILKYFNSAFSSGTDYNINHFASETILQNRVYEELY